MIFKELCSRNETPAVSWVRSGKPADTSQQTQKEVLGMCWEDQWRGNGTLHMYRAAQTSPECYNHRNANARVCSTLTDLCTNSSVCHETLEILPEEQLTQKTRQKHSAWEILH